MTAEELTYLHIHRGRGSTASADVACFYADIMEQHLKMEWEGRIEAYAELFKSKLQFKSARYLWTSSDEEGDDL
jgi:hypothetical protein